MNARDPSTESEAIDWQQGGTGRVPAWVYTDPEVYREELERFFYRGHWCYVGLEAEVPNPGDFKRTAIGERSVIVVRLQDGRIACVENRCAHRGVAFCRAAHGNRRDFTCPYHQWNYSLAGDLQGVPLRRGVKRDGRLQGGMPADFDPAAHGLTKLAVATRGGVVFASFDPGVEPLEDYIGARLLPWFDRSFRVAEGRRLTLLGTSRQRIPGNWKLMQENIKDPYHPGLLHTWFVTFGLWRADQQSRMLMDDRRRHACMISRRNAAGAGEVTQGVGSFKAGMRLEDPRLLDVEPEPWWGEPSVVMTTVFPSLIVQQQINSLSTRQILPRGPGCFDFVWTHFGFDDDTPPMTARRLRQANLFGPAGYVSADDGEVIELAQAGLAAGGGFHTLSELDGRAAPTETPHMVTEALIRGMTGYWRQVMER
jgi:salicylate 5-hydroxylase large subunit